MKSINRESLVVLLAVFVIALLFSGCGGSGGNSNGISAGGEGVFSMSVAWPDGSGRSESKIIPLGSETITISVTGENQENPITASIFYGSETSVLVSNIPVGQKIALIQALDSSGNLKAQRKESFEIIAGQTATADHVPLGVAITGSLATFEPSFINVPLDSTVYFQNWTDSPVTVTTDGDPVNIAAASEWTIPESNKQAVDFETLGIENNSSLCDIVINNAAKIKGIATKGGVPVEGAKIKIGAMEFTTLADGKYSFSPVFTLGNLNITATKTLLANYSSAVSASSATITEKNIEMSDQAKWQKYFGGTADETTRSINQTSDGGYIIGGFSKSSSGDLPSNYGDFDGWVMKTDSDCNKVWSRNYGGSNNDRIFEVRQTSDGGYICIGLTKSNDQNVSGNHNVGTDDIWVVKLSENGDISWQKCFGGSGTDTCFHINQTSDEGYIFSGFTSSTTGDFNGYTIRGSVDGYVMKLDSSGNKSWLKVYGGTYDDGVGNVYQISDGSYISVGFTNSIDYDLSGVKLNGYNNYDIWVMKLNSDGTRNWQKCYGTSGEQVSYNLLPIAGGGYIIGGYTTDNSNETIRDVWVFKIDSSGSQIWQKRFSGSGDDYVGLSPIIPTDDGGYVIAGQTASSNGDSTGNNGGIDGWLAKLNSDGSKAWHKCYGGASDDIFVYACRAIDGGYICAGRHSQNAGDGFIVKTDENGNAQ